MVRLTCGYRDRNCALTLGLALLQPLLLFAPHLARILGLDLPGRLDGHHVFIVLDLIS